MTAKHAGSIKRDGVGYWYWSCSCGAEGASWTTPYNARTAFGRFHPEGAL
jgi:hypothetical protein